MEVKLISPKHFILINDILRGMNILELLFECKE